MEGLGFRVSVFFKEGLGFGGLWTEGFWRKSS